MISSGWIVSDSATNNTATAERDGAPGITHCLDAVIASFKTNPAAPVLLQVKDGNEVILKYYVRSDVYIPLHGVLCKMGNAASAVLGAGGEGNVGEVALIGHPR